MPGPVECRGVARRIEGLEPDLAAGKDGAGRDETGRGFDGVAIHAARKGNLVDHRGFLRL
jgi:hypothetical protein